MKRSEIIKKALAGIMLLVFTISVTPKKYIHDLFSCHTDYPANTVDRATPQLTAYQFNCGFVNTVAVTPFTPVQPITINYYCNSFSLLPGIALSGKPVNVLFSYFSHRGPPTA